MLITHIFNANSQFLICYFPRYFTFIASLKFHQGGWSRKEIAATVVFSVVLFLLHIFAIFTIQPNTISTVLIFVFFLLKVIYIISAVLNCAIFVNEIYACISPGDTLVIYSYVFLYHYQGTYKDCLLFQCSQVRYFHLYGSVFCLKIYY